MNDIQAIKSQEEGRAEDKKENAIEAAKKMFLEAILIDLIVELSGHSLSEINTFKVQMVYWAHITNRPSPKHPFEEGFINYQQEFIMRIR